MKRFFHFFLIAALMLMPVRAYAQGFNPAKVLGSTIESVSSGDVPAMGSCGTSPTGLTAGATNFIGEVTTGTSTTSCVVTLGGTHALKPICSVTWEATPLASQSWAVSIASGVVSLTITQTSASNNKFVYICAWPSGGR